MRINHNISALRASTSLNRTESLLSKSSERLASGFKINRAHDDAAGFSISKRMRTQIRAIERSSQNAADGISVLQSAEGALNEMSAMLGRMKELAVQAASDTNSGEDRDAIQNEIDQLRDEITRISTDSAFNSKRLLNGEVGRKSVTDVTGVTVLRTTDTVAAGNYGVTVTRDPRQAVLVSGAGNAGAFDAEGITVSGKVTINGEVIGIKKGESMEEVYNKLRVGAERAGINLFAYGSGPDAEGDRNLAGYTSEAFSEGAQLTLVSKLYGSDAKIEVECTEELADALGFSAEKTKTEGTDAEVKLKTETDIEKNIKGFDKTATVQVKGDRAVIKDAGGFEMEIKIAPGISGTGFTDADTGGTRASHTASEDVDIKLTVLDAGYMTFQIGANTGDSVDLSIGRLDAETLGLDRINLRLGKDANQAITVIDRAIDKVSAERGKLGAFQNRLEHTILSLDETSENMTAAFSRIVDTDMAEEMTEYTAKQILQQAGTGVLAQANERPQTVLTLLQS